MIDWGSGYSSTWRVYEVDPKTWADSGELSGVRSISIERDASGNAPLLESGTISLDDDISGTFRERYIRIVLVAHQQGISERVEVSTLLCGATDSTIGYGVETRSLVGRSVLWPANTRRLTPGSYVRRGSDGAEWVADILRECLSAPVVQEGSFALDETIVFCIGDTVLEAVWAVLDAGGFCLQITGNGTVRVMPRPSTPELSLDDAGARLLRPGITRSFDLSEVPSRYIAVEGELVSIAENDNPDSPTSSVYRGYTVDMVDDTPQRRSGETLSAYCRRRLSEESTIVDERSYSREFWPGIFPLSIVRGTMSGIGLDGDMRVTRQSLTCDKGITVSERAEGEVKTWTE